MRQYYTLCTWEESETDEDRKCGLWYDAFGSYSRRECQEEWDFAHDHMPRGWVKIIKHDDTAAAMIAARDALPAPKRDMKLDE